MLESRAGFRPYATAYLISEAGSAVSLIVMPILVYQRTSSSLWTAAVGAASAVPYLVLGFFAGAIADRRPRANLMVAANAVSGIVVLSIPLAYRLGHLSALQVVVVAVVSQSAFVFYDAANFGYLVSIVGRDGILAANGFLYSAMSLIEALASAAVGLALAHIATPYFVVFDAASFLTSAFLISAIPARDVEEPPAAVPGQNLLTFALAGLRYFGQNRTVSRMTLISALMTAANGGIMSVLIIWISHTFGMRTDDSRIGVYYAAIAVAGLVAGKLAEISARKWSAPVAMRRFIPLSVVLAYAMLLVHLWWVGAALLGISSGLALASVILAVTVRQQVIPDQLQSRVNTLGRMFAFGLGFSVGSVISGGLGQALPIGVALAIVLLIRVAAAGLSYLPMPVVPVAAQTASPTSAVAVHSAYAISKPLPVRRFGGLPDLH